MKNTVVKNGVILGVIMAGLFLVFHFINPRLNLESMLGILISIALPVYFMRRGALEERAKNDGVMSFGELFSVTFPIFVIGTLIHSIVSIIIMQMDPIYMQLSTEIALESIDKVFDLMGRFTEVSEDDKLKAIEEIKNNPPKMGIGTMILGYFIQLLFPGAVISAIISAVFKKA